MRERERERGEIRVSDGREKKGVMVGNLNDTK